MELYHIPEAAGRLGVSVPTLKQWIYRKKIRSVKTAGGHHRIPAAEVHRLLFQKHLPKALERARKWKRPPGEGSAAGLERVISGRNQLVGRITSLRSVGLLTKVSLDIGGQTVTAIITSDACRDLGLQVGETAAALIKATEVMIIRPPA